MSIFTFHRNPKEKLREETKPTEINFDNLGLQIMFPPTIKCRQSAFRGVWLSYDNFSDYCPSFYMPYRKRTSRNLRMTTKIEWFKRLEILQSTLDQPEEEIETESLEQEEDEASLKSRVIDVDKVYTEYEDTLKKEERKKRGPESLFLGEFEVNLRKCRLVGGIFCIDYLQQPIQNLKISQKTFMRTCKLILLNVVINILINLCYKQ